MVSASGADLPMSPANPVIEIRQTRGGDPLEFEVTVREPSGQTQHRVTISGADHARLTGGRYPPGRCIEASMRFLLEREPKEAILRQFDVSVIGQYFSDFEAQLPRYLPGVRPNREA